MVMPTPLGNVGTQSIASYDYFDYAANAGYKKFYGVGAKDSVGLKYFLTNQTMDSHVSNIYTQITSGSSTLNFDLTFNNPATIAAADCYINFTNYLATSSTGYMIFTIKHVRGGVETTLGTVQSDTRTTAGSTDTLRMLVKATLTQKDFAIGDILRISATLTGGTYRLWHDTGRSGTTENSTGNNVSTSLVINIPFRIDI